MLVKPHDYIRDALNNQYALGAFNTVNMEMSQAIVRAAEKKESAVIIQTSESAIEYGGIRTLAGIIKTLAEESRIPVMLHLDHGKNVDSVRRCVEAGYGSVMIDASKEVLAKNIAITREAVKVAHGRGVWVEAELGAILGAEGALDLKGGRTPDGWLTKPQQVVEFVEQTGVDALAVSVGTIHGAFTGQEYIRFELVEQIEKAMADFPLVIHGASGIGDQQLRRAASSNVCKVNVDTELRIAFTEAVKAYFQDTHAKTDIRDIIGPAREAMQRVAEKKIDVFGSSGMADL